MNAAPTTRLNAPAADLDALTLCATDPGALAEWVISLPMANTADTAARIRQVTWEVARVNVPAAERMALLEQIRPILHYLCARLDRNAGSSSQHGDAIGRLAQRLETNLCAGYKAVVLAALAERRGAAGRSDADDELLPLALHRALSDLSRTLLRTLQFYVEPADGLWLELNQLYLLAERLGVAATELEDAENHTTPMTTPTQAYLRSVLLASCKPNQLRHRQLAEVFNSLESWAPLVTLTNGPGDALLAVDLESDRGPVYQRLLRHAAEPRGIRTDVLAYELDGFLQDRPGTLRIADGITGELARHLAQAWGTIAPRAHRRAPVGGPIRVCIGLRATHYFLSGGVDFADQLNETDALLTRELDPFLVQPRSPPADPSQPRGSAAVKEVWDDAFDPAPRSPQNPAVEDPGRALLPARERERSAAAPRSEHHGYDVFATAAVDTSPGGYQVRWHDPLPANLQTGELVAMREGADRRWCIGVVRWIRQDRSGTAMGIELLSPRGIPVAVRVIQKVGGPTGYARALLLPELRPIGQPAMLITPRVPFQSGQKIHIQRQGLQSTAQLLQCIQKTESVNQFTYRMLAGYLENARSTPKMAGQ